MKKVFLVIALTSICVSQVLAASSSFSFGKKEITNGIASGLSTDSGYVVVSLGNSLADADLDNLNKFQFNVISFYIPDEINTPGTYKLEVFDQRAVSKDDDPCAASEPITSLPSTDRVYMLATVFRSIQGKNFTRVKGETAVSEDGVGTFTIDSTAQLGETTLLDIVGSYDIKMKTQKYVQTAPNDEAVCDSENIPKKVKTKVAKKVRKKTSTGSFNTGFTE